MGTDGEDIRMVDCAFSQICSLMGDLSPRVRASAMSLLGTVKVVSQRYIEQALDKKQKIVEADRPEVEEKSGSCGAFIHGLEDEFLEVKYCPLHLHTIVDMLSTYNRMYPGTNCSGRSSLYFVFGATEYSQSLLRLYGRYVQR